MVKENKISNKTKGDLNVIIDVNEFYNKDNWKQYVPLEAFKELTKHVAETHLRDTTVKNLLSITYSVDDYGENPIYIEYLDEKDQKHLVKLKPAIHEELDNVLKQYAKITYVDTEITKALQASKDYTDGAKEALTILINGSKEEAIQVSKAYTDVEINKLNTNLKQYVDEHDEILWNEIVTYTDTAVENATLISEQYTDQEVNKAKQEVKNYADTQDNAKLLESKEYTDTKYNQALNAIETGDTQTLEASKSYTNTQLENYETKTDASVDHDKLSTVPIGHKNPFISWYPNIDSHYIRIAPDQNEIKLHIHNSQTDVETIGYLSSRNPKDFATTSDVTPLTNKLSNIWASHKAPFIYWLPNIDVNTMKLEDTENDVKVTLNDGDVVYWRKNAYQPVDLSGIEVGDTQTLEASKAYTDTQLASYETKAEATTDHNKLFHVPTGKKLPYIRWYPNIECSQIKFSLSGTEIGVHIDKRDENGEKVGYLSSRNPSTFATKDDIGDISSEISNLHNKDQNLQDQIDSFKTNVFNVSYPFKISGTLKNGWAMKHQDPMEDFGLMWGWNNNDDHSQGVHFTPVLNYL